MSDITLTQEIGQLWYLLIRNQHNYNHLIDAEILNLLKIYGYLDVKMINKFIFWVQYNSEKTIVKDFKALAKLLVDISLSEEIERSNYERLFRE